jgi:hypothetical protein
LWQQIFWNTFYIRCAYVTPNCTWSLNYSVLVLFLEKLKILQILSEAQI